MFQLSNDVMRTGKVRIQWIPDRRGGGIRCKVIVFDVSFQMQQEIPVLHCDLIALCSSFSSSHSRISFLVTMSVILHSIKDNLISANSHGNSNRNDSRKHNLNHDNVIKKGASRNQ